MSTIDIVIVGAGVAGLAAALTLRQAGVPFALLEASERVGGRAWTVRPPALEGAHFDMGAIWLHGAETNPLVPIAACAGERLVDSDAIRHRRTLVGERLVDRLELAGYAGAWERFETAADALLAEGGPDPALAAVALSLTEDPWARTVETWEGPIICVADADALSLRDWKHNLLEGGNLLPEGGLGDLVARRLTPENGLHLGTTVERLRWQEPGGKVVVETARGALEARAAIVTVSTGVLGAGLIDFEPPLPPRTQEALHGLPMGLALRVVLRATGSDRLGLPPFCSIDRQFQPGDAAIVFSAWPWDFNYISAWIGGSLAWELARAGPDAATDFTRRELRKLLGAGADRALAPRAALISEWGQSPLFLGSYAYARPGHAGAREVLAEPLGGGRLVIAGEATHSGLAGTVGGAWLTGETAARAVMNRRRP
ncbi:MAG: FAD-dependent oxidoreductase [Acetobacteraceae bacterium]|nr:FAD-dependent oxidoreductase [Acetobacteraceae bacterium]